MRNKIKEGKFFANEFYFNKCKSSLIYELSE